MVQPDRCGRISVEQVEEAIVERGFAAGDHNAVERCRGVDLAVGVHDRVAVFAVPGEPGAVVTGKITAEEVRSFRQGE